MKTGSHEKLDNIFVIALIIVVICIIIIVVVICVVFVITIVRDILVNHWLHIIDRSSQSISRHVNRFSAPNDTQVFYV